MRITKSTVFKYILLMFLGYIFINSFGSLKLNFDHNHISSFNNESVKFRGIIIDEADKRINHTKLTIKVNHIFIDNTWQKSNGQVLASVSLYPEFFYGDEVEISCQLKKPEEFNGFAYDRYLAKDDIYSICSFAKAKLISAGHGDYILTKIYKFKNELQSIINKNLPEPQASFFSAMILGSRRGIPDDLQDDFRDTGTAHLIAISGLHITLLSAIIMNLCLALYLSRKKSFWAMTIFLVTYIILIGSPASAVRAGLMGWLMILSIHVGRLNQSINSMLLAASLMVLFNPSILRDDIGFQLSFSAVLGIIYFVPMIEKYFVKVPNFLGLRESLQMSIAAQIATAPLVIWYFNQMSVIGPLSNMLILFLLPFLMLLSLGSLLAGWLIPLVGQYLFWIVYFVLTLMIKIIEILSQVPHAAINF